MNYSLVNELQNLVWSCCLELSVNRNLNLYHRWSKCNKVHLSICMYLHCEMECEGVVVLVTLVAVQVKVIWKLHSADLYTSWWCSVCAKLICDCKIMWIYSWVICLVGCAVKEMYCAKYIFHVISWRSLEWWTSGN